MTTSDDSGARAAEIDAARVLLARMGIAPEDLVQAAAQRPLAPTFDEYIPRVAQAVSVGTRRVYSSYWNRIRAWWGQRRLDEPTAVEIKQCAEYVRTHVVSRRNARGGRGAAEHFIAAMRCVYHHAVADGVIREADNPARRVAQSPPGAVHAPRAGRGAGGGDQPGRGVHGQ